MFRVEVNYQNIGVEIQTPIGLNPTRLRYTQDSRIWNILTQLVDISLQNNITLFKACHMAVEQNYEIASFLPGIWEVLFEKAKPATIPLRRTECAFFFETIEDALQFRSSYPGMEMATLCEVETIEEHFSMRADMKWLDNIDYNNETAAEAIVALKKYWAGEMTANPVVEILFIGKFKLNPVK